MPDSVPYWIQQNTVCIWLCLFWSQKKSTHIHINSEAKLPNWNTETESYHASQTTSSAITIILMFNSNAYSCTIPKEMAKNSIYKYFAANIAFSLKNSFFRYLWLSVSYLLKTYFSTKLKIYKLLHIFQRKE